MLVLLNKPTIKEILSKNQEKTKKEIVFSKEKPKNTLKTKSENMVNSQEEEYLKKREIINNALKSQIDDINNKLESRKFLKFKKKEKSISKKNSLFLGFYKLFFMKITFFA